MGKKRQKIKGTSLRILSIAYASGRIDRKTYLKLRTQQLGALEFNKPLPELSADLSEIIIPTVKVDTPHEVTFKKKTSSVWIYATSVLALIIAIGAGLWYAEILPIKEDKLPQARQLEPRDYAKRLMANTDWSERDIGAFLRTWGTRTPAAKSTARNSEWYLSLENEIIKRINQAKLKLEIEPESVIAQRELAKLRLFYGQLTSN